MTQPKTVRNAILSAMACVLGLTGCIRGTRTVYIPNGEPVRLRQSLKGVKVWAADKDGKEVPGKIDLPEGWYALPK